MKSKGLEAFQQPSDDNAILEEALELYSNWTKEEKKSLVAPGVPVIVTDESNCYADKPQTFDLTNLQHRERLSPNPPITIEDQIYYAIHNIQPRRRTTWKNDNQGDLIIVRCPETKRTYELEIVGYEGWLYFTTTASAGTSTPVHLRIKDDRGGRAVFYTREEIIDTLTTNNFYVSK